MKKKIALALASLLALSIVVATPLYLQKTTVEAQPPPPPWHWKIMLAQANCNAWIFGYLTLDDVPIDGTDFFLNCTCELPEPQPKGQFIFWKVATSVIPNDIHYWKYIDDDKNPSTPPIEKFVTHPIPYFDPEYEYLIPEEPHTWYEHVEEGEGPFGQWMVVVEVREQPYDEERPFFEWQIMMKTHGLPLPTTLWGYLTKDGVPLPGTDFDLVGITDPDLQCQVVRTPYCTVPNDIYAELLINDMPPAIIIDEDITQFPWKYRYWVDPPFVYVDLEVTEVQSHRYMVMEGWFNTAGQFGAFPPWDLNGWQINSGVPFATRAPYLTPRRMGQNITFTQRDPITGIVKLGVPAESYVGLDHMYYSAAVGTWFRAQIVLETQGCGWLFTGVGKQPIFGSVDLLTYNNYSGVYTFGPDLIAKTADDGLLAGQVAGGSAGAGPPIGPCLQQLRGSDDIPGTGDDPIGRGDPDGPNPPGSSILYLPTIMTTHYWDGGGWSLWFSSPWPQLLTTGTATDTVMEPSSMIDGASSTQAGQPWEFFAGLDHPAEQVPWKHAKCNAYVHYATVWSVLGIPTALGNLDILFEFEEKKVRDDCVIADINCDEVVNLVDVIMAAFAFGAEDEWIGPDGIPGTPDDKPVSDPGFDARGDVSLWPDNLVDIYDLCRICCDFGKALTSACIASPY